MLAQIVLFDGFDPMDALAPYEVLEAGGMASGGRLRAELVTVGTARAVPSGIGPAFPADAVLDPDRADLIVVPGAAGAMSGEGPGSVVAKLRDALPALAGPLRAAIDRPGLTVATVCGGSLLLGMAGLLAGRPAVTHHQGMDALAAMGALPVRARVVDDGDLVTAGGATSGLDLGVHLLERELGPRVAHAVETMLEYERRGTVWRAGGHEPVAL